jgi:DNA mismatch repair protein MutS
MAKSGETPLMKQYAAIKAKYGDAILLFRVGDFYETFGQDAVKASKILDIVLTKRGNGSASEIELAGFPHHALDNYLPKLIRAGERVAVCDQLEDPKFAQGIVKRGVTELVTPGLTMSENVLEGNRNNYLACVSAHPKNPQIYGAALLDISTGEFSLAEGSQEHIEKIIMSHSPAEIILSRDKKHELAARFDRIPLQYLEEWIFTADFADEKIKNHFGINTLKGFGVEEMQAGILSAGATLHYLEITEHKQIAHITTLNRIDEGQHVWLDKFTIRNLEIIAPLHENGQSLVRMLDRTCTNMGARLLRKWLFMPLKDVKKIRQRLDITQAIIADDIFREEARALLKDMADLERMLSKIATGRINPREMLRLKKSLQILEPLQALCARSQYVDLQKIGVSLDPCSRLTDSIEKELREDPPLAVHLGATIKAGINEDLDMLRAISSEGKEFLDKIVVREVERTGITSLKISFNKVFGYYIEVTNAHKNKVPDDWIRKQTLVNAERYITPELKEYEEKIVTAEEKIASIEHKIYFELVKTCSDYIVPIQKNAQVVAMLDVLLSNADTALIYKYCKPEVDESFVIDIKDGRHPVIERQLPPESPYVPNDVYLDNEKQQIIVITGPNMSGKSAILRQTALTVIMAQAGFYVPAREARIGLTDKVFTRVGASDNISQGESTFMVEMTETASIMNNLSNRSLVLLDEIGRGTSTYDGISIAWSLAEFLHEHHYKAKTLFATHYHELNQLADDFERVKNFHVAVKESNGKVLFLRKLREGGTEHSFGIHVAQMAGMPKRIILRAEEILQHFEQSKIRDRDKSVLKKMPKKVTFQTHIFETVSPNYTRMKEILKGTDINTLTPIEAMMRLNELIKLAEGEK